MLAGIREILRHLDAAGHAALRASCWATAAQWGLALSYAVQPRPEGLAQAFIIGREFVGGEPVCARPRRQHLLRPRPRRIAAARRGEHASGATVFAYQVNDPERYGVVEFDAQGPRASASRRSRASRSRTTRSPGLYFYDNAGRRHRRDAQALGARRARDHRRQPRLPRARRARGRGDGPRHRLARHRHARVRCSRRRTSSRPSSSARASRSPAPRRSPTAWATSTRAQLERLAEPLEKNALRPVPARGADATGCSR